MQEIKNNNNKSAHWAFIKEIQNYITFKVVKMDILTTQ